MKVASLTQDDFTLCSDFGRTGLPPTGRRTLLELRNHRPRRPGQVRDHGDEAGGFQRVRRQAEEAGARLHAARVGYVAGASPPEPGDYAADDEFSRHAELVERLGLFGEHYE